MKAELVYVSAVWAKTDLVGVTLWPSPVIRKFSFFIALCDLVR